MELVRSIHDVPGCVDRSRIESVNYPDVDGCVHIPEGGYISTVDGEYKPYHVVVLYEIMVTGDVGDAYRVTDPGAVYVGGDPMSGVIPEDGDAVLYVTRDFMNIQIGDDGYIRNTATVTPGRGEESSSSFTETTPVVMGKTRMLSVGVNMHFSCLETGDDGVLRELMSLSDIPTAFELSYEYTDTDGVEHTGTWTYDDATVFSEKISGTNRSVPALTWPILSIKIEDGESIPIKFRQSGYVIDVHH